MNMAHIAIYHSPACGTSRNTLALIRNSGAEPEVIEYLKAPTGGRHAAGRQAVLTQRVGAGHFAERTTKRLHQGRR